MASNSLNNKLVDIMQIFDDAGTKFFIFENTLIITSNKCGSRFLADSSKFISYDYRDPDIINKVDKIYWIIREPMQHFLAAVLTEHNGLTDTHPDNQVKTQINNFYIRVKEKEDILKYDILKKMIDDLAKPIHFKNNTQNTNGMFSHYYPKFESLYTNLITNYEFFNKVTFIKLERLSDLIRNELGIDDIIFNKNNYLFEKYYTKNQIAELLKTDFKKKWKILEPIIRNDTEYYNKILEFKYSDFIVSKITNLYEELGNCISIFIKRKHK